MRAIGIRELRQHASRYLREVERGATIEVTDRGRPVARLVPIQRRSVMEDLIASGRVTPAKGDLLDLGPPLEPVEGQPLPSEALARMRADER
ncbi:MAG: type II toxin-antitoxin system prevent-host-death family antitoxin [Thermoleophilaceae bacterium]|nr:type II toxin-antitoxin system prevent-host-death family antitoxin [Thermoleophilaceae bacterium]